VVVEQVEPHQVGDDRLASRRPEVKADIHPARMSAAHDGSTVGSLRPQHSAILH
jgi:hypothetical protein